MAIWQYNYFNMIPKAGLITQFGEIPTQICLEKNADQLVKGGILTPDYTYIQAAWTQTQQPACTIADALDVLIRPKKQENPDYWAWKTARMHYTSIDNDACMGIEPVTGWIEYLSFRPDLREPKWTFLAQMIELAQQYDWILQGCKGMIVTADPQAVQQLICKTKYWYFRPPIFNAFFEEPINSVYQGEPDL